MNRRQWALTGAGCVAVILLALVIVSLVVSSGGSASPGWSAPERVPISASAVPSATAIVDPAGRPHVAWAERREGRWELHEAFRERAGVWSTAGGPATTGSFRTAVVGLAANARGDAAMLWIYAAERHQVLMGSTRPAGGAWSQGQSLSRVTGGLLVTGVGMDASGTTTVIGKGLDGPGLWTTRARVGGDWTVLRRISPAGLSVDRPVLQVAPDGRASALALLKRDRRPPALWFTQADAKGLWSKGELVPGSDYASQPQLARADDGTPVTAWLSQVSTTARLLVSARSGGKWPTPAAIEGPTSDFLGPVSLIAEPRGATAVWPRWDSRPEDRQASIRTQQITGQGTLEPPAQVASLRLAPANTSQGAIVIYGPPPVQLVVARTPGPTVMWNATSESAPKDPATVQVSSQSGGAWSAPVQLSTSGRFSYPLAAGGSGERAIAMWAEGPPTGAADRMLVAER